MATTLTGLRVQDTYNAILKIGDNSNLTGTAKLLSDGLGNASSVYLSTTRLGIGVTPTYQFQTSANAKIGGNLIIAGDLTVNGTTTIIDSTIIAIGDNMIEMAKGNTANTKDIGWYGKIVSTGTKYVGMAYDASTGIATPKFNLGFGTVEPGNTFATTVTGTLIANLEGNVTGNVTGNLTGNVTGNLTGNVTGDLTGNVTGNLSGNVTGGTISGTTGTFTGAVSTGRNINLSSTDYAYIQGTHTSAADGEYVMRTFGYGDSTFYGSFDILKHDTDDGELRLRQRISGTATDVLSIVDGNATFSGLVTGIAPTADLNFATKKYVDDNIPTITTPALSAVLAVGNTSGSNNLIIQDDDELILGSGTDHNQTNTLFRINTGDLIFNSFVTDGDIKFQLDNGSGSLTEYLRLDGGAVKTIANKNIAFIDNVKAEFGDSGDLELWFSSADGYLRNNTGDLYIQNLANDKSIVFQSDNGIGGVTEYLKIDGNINRNVILVTTQLNDNVPMIFGDGAGRPSIKYDSTASQLFINGDTKFLSDAYVVNNLNVQKSVYQTATGGFYISKPYGADFYTTTNNYTGAIEIALPTGGTGHDDMIKFVVDIFDYRTQESVTVFVGGYTYQNVGSGNTTWYYVSATVLGQSANQNYTVRFGDNGTEHCVWIGDTDSTWNHLQVIVRDFFAGYNADINNYLGAWDINVVTTQTTVNNTLTNCFPMSSDTITGYLPLTGGTVTGNVLLGSNTNISMDASANGQLMIDGVGYQGAIALDENAMHIYHNSSSRNLVLGTNETARLTIDGVGNSVFSGAVTSASLSAASIGVSGSNGTDGKGISLYAGANSGEPTYGMMFQQTATYGTFGYVTGNWATYFTMNGSSNRGWIFRKVGVGNVASINNDGHAHFQTPTKITSNDTSLTFEDAGTNAFQIKVGAGDELYIGSNNTYQFRGTTTGQAYINSAGYFNVTSGGSNYAGIEMYQTDGSRVGFLYGDGGANSTPSFGILDSDGNWAVRVIRDTYTELRVNNIVKLQTTTAINYNLQPTWIEGGSANWNETTPGLTTGSLHLVPAATDNFGSAITFGASDRFSGTNAQAGIYTRTDGAYGTKMYFATCGSYTTGSRTQMMIDYTGNIGVNQTSPLQKLEIQTGTDTDGIIITGDGSSMSTGQYRRIGFRYSNTDSSYSSEIRFTVPVGGIHGGAIAFNTHQSGSATMNERGRFNQYGQLLINATSSGYSSNLYGYNLGVRGNSSQAFISICQSNQTLDTQGLIVGIDNNNAYFISRDNKNIDFYNNNAFKMRLNTSGQLGIGEDSPAQKLQVAGNIRVGDVAGSGRPYIDFVRNGGAVVGGIGWHTDDSFYIGAHPSAGPNAGNITRVYGFDNELRLGCTSYGDVMFITEGGNKARVGIGGSPSSAAGVHNFLSIKGSSHSGIMLQDTDGGAIHEMWNDGGTLNMWDSSVGYRIRFYTSGDAQAYNGWTADSIGVSGTNGTDGKGISLYSGASGGEPTYGMMFMQTGTFGTYGSVTSDYATYFTMNNNASRGWIFRRVGSGNYASISGGGDLSLSGQVVFPTTNQRIAGLNSSYLQIKSGSASDGGINLVNTSGTNLVYLYGSGSDAGMLNAGGYWIFKHSQGGNTHLYSGNQNHVWQFQGSNGYLLAPAWINLAAGTGIYTSTNGAHFYGNTGGTYGAWRTAGSRNGYSGTYDNHSTNTANMFDSGGNGGNYDATSGWHFYHNRTNLCLGVGNSTTSSSYSLYVTGSIYSTADVIAYSDKRAKENIVTVDSAIDKVNKLRGVYYTPKEGEDKSRKVGVIAQEILEVLPEVVTHDKENDRYGVDYGKITGLLIEAIKDQQKQIDKLTKFVDKLNK